MSRQRALELCDEADRKADQSSSDLRMIRSVHKLSEAILELAKCIPPYQVHDYVDFVAAKNKEVAELTKERDELVAKLAKANVELDWARKNLKPGITYLPENERFQPPP